MLMNRNWVRIWCWDHGMDFGYGIVEVPVWMILDPTCSLCFNLDVIPSGKPSMIPSTLSLWLRSVPLMWPLQDSLISSVFTSLCHYCRH